MTMQKDVRDCSAVFEEVAKKRYNKDIYLAVGLMMPRNLIKLWRKR